MAVSLDDARRKLRAGSVSETARPQNRELKWKLSDDTGYRSLGDFDVDPV